MSAELDAARAVLDRVLGVRLAASDAKIRLQTVQAHAAIAQAAALERIADWMENVQLADLTAADEAGDDEIRDGWAEAFDETPPMPTREQRERAEAESYWATVAVGDEMRVDWGDGYVGSVAKQAPDQPLHPQVARVRSAAQ